MSSRKERLKREKRERRARQREIAKQYTRFLVSITSFNRPKMALDLLKQLKKESENIISDNLDMFCNLLRHKSKYKKLIHFGSGAQEEPNSFYGISKKTIDLLIKNIDSFYNIKIYGLFDENELDTRFIKASVRRALNGEDIIVHKDRRMDFFHMKDLLSLIDYYINNTDLEKNVDCSYKTTLTLCEIGNIIKEK